MTKTPAIVLSTVKYGESDLIARLYTKELGTQSFMLKGLRKSKKGRLRSSHFLPLTQLEIHTNFKGKGSLEYIKEARVLHPYKTLHTQFIKSTITLFFSEVLTQVLVEQQPDERLYNYLANSMLLLDQIDEVANFSIKALLELSDFMGFRPDDSDNHSPYFSLLHGHYDNDGMQPHHATLEESKLLRAFLGTTFDAIHTIKMNRQERTAMLHMVVDYFQIHLHTFKKPASLEILKQLYNS